MTNTFHFPTNYVASPGKQLIKNWDKIRVREKTHGFPKMIIVHFLIYILEGFFSYTCSSSSICHILLLIELYVAKIIFFSPKVFFFQYLKGFLPYLFQVFIQVSPSERPCLNTLFLQPLPPPRVMAFLSALNNHLTYYLNLLN